MWGVPFLFTLIIQICVLVEVNAWTTVCAERDCYLFTKTVLGLPTCAYIVNPIGFLFPYISAFSIKGCSLQILISYSIKPHTIWVPLLFHIKTVDKGNEQATPFSLQQCKQHFTHKGGPIKSILHKHHQQQRKIHTAMVQHLTSI